MSHEAKCPAAQVVLEYLYRDAANWKTYGEVLLAGEFTPNHTLLMRKLLGADCTFIPEQVGLPSLHAAHAATFGSDPDLDHAFHEFVGLRQVDGPELLAPKPLMSIDEFIVVLEAISSDLSHFK